MANNEDKKNPTEQEEVDDEDEEVKWLKYYSSDHQILLVGDGDFSFSLSLANCFGSASNIVSTSLDPHDKVVTKYSNAKSNLETLKKLGATVIHGVDATKMKFHTDLKMRKFDRIIFNFPHAGFYGKEGQGHLIMMHRTLVQGFFKNASGMLRPYGEVHVNHKTTAPFNHWNLAELASKHLLGLIECVDFKKEDYPGYNNKRGAGPRCDEPFPLGECSTFKFKIFPNMKRKVTQEIPGIVHTEQTQKVPEIQFRRVQYPGSFNLGYHQAVPMPNMPPEIWKTVALPVINNATNDCHWIFQEYFREGELMFGRTDYDVRQATLKYLGAGFDRYMTGTAGRDINGYIMLLQELHRLSLLRLERLRGLPFPNYF